MSSHRQDWLVESVTRLIRRGALPNVLKILDKARPAFERAETVALQECARCGQVTTSTVCAFCKLADQVKRAVLPAGAPPASPQ